MALSLFDIDDAVMVFSDTERCSADHLPAARRRADRRFAKRCAITSMTRWRSPRCD